MDICLDGNLKETMTNGSKDQKERGKEKEERRENMNEETIS